MKRTFNIQHSTFNVQRSRNARCSFIRHWKLNVQCSMFALAILSLFVPLAVFGQTNALPALSPPYGELPPTFWERHGTGFILVGLGVVVLVAFGVWLVLRPKPKIIVPPEILARQALEALREQPEDGACLSRISQILRNYFIAAFQLAPGEFTTAEFSRALATCEPVDAGLSAAAADLLRDCDAQKFSPAPAVNLDAVSRALQIVTQAEDRRAQLRRLAETPTPAART